MPARGGETYLELTYQYEVMPWWQLQPDIQYVFNPGGGIANANAPLKRVGNELVLGLRTNIQFRGGVMAKATATDVDRDAGFRYCDLFAIRPCTELRWRARRTRTKDTQMGFLMRRTRARSLPAHQNPVAHLQILQMNHSRARQSRLPRRYAYDFRRVVRHPWQPRRPVHRRRG